MDINFEMVIVGVVAFFIGVLITRWIFGIDRQLQNQRAMLWFLMKMAEKQEVSKEDINGAIKTFNIK